MTEDAAQRRKEAKRIKAWKGLKVAGQFRFGLPQDPPSLLDTMEARDQAIGADVETQGRLQVSVPRMDGSLELARDGLDMDTEPKAHSKRQEEAERTQAWKNRPTEGASQRQEEA